MQKTKLTLSIDPLIVERAKKVARRKGVSVSEMVEHYLNRISEATESPVQVIQLRGCAQGELSRMSDQEIRDLMYKEKHGI